MQSRNRVASELKDVVIGHAAPVVGELLYRPKLLERLREIAPGSSYEFIERPFGPTTIRVLDERGQETWSWTLPLQAYNRWVLTVEEFLQLEIWRLTGKMA